ncbi:SDR family NAD(P)-dependent oxidoreductase [Vibrio olivae]
MRHKGIEAEGADALILQGDTASSASCKQAVEEVVAQWGGIDVLINNAGMQKPYNDLSEVSDEDWQQHFDINMAGIFLCHSSGVRAYEGRRQYH